MNLERQKQLVSLVKGSIKEGSYNWNALLNEVDKLQRHEAYFTVRIAENIIKYCFKPKEMWEKSNGELSPYQKQTLTELYNQEQVILNREAELLEKIYECEDNNQEVYLLMRILDRITFNQYYIVKVNALESLQANVLPKKNLLSNVIYKAMSKNGVKDISYIQEKLKGNTFPQLKFSLEQEINIRDCADAV